MLNRHAYSGVASTAGLWALVLTCTMGIAAGQGTINILDYWNDTPGAEWHFVFDGQPEASSDADDFTYQVQADSIDVGGPVPAARFLTIADEITDDRHLDEDFFVADRNGSGNLYFFGTKLTLPDEGVPIPPQTIILDDPIMLGGPGITLGQTIFDTGSATGIVDFGLGPTSVPISFTAEITHLEILPVFDTGAGPFTNVLHSRMNITGTASFGPFSESFDIPLGELWLNECGILAQDQLADPDDAQSQWIDRYTVPGKDTSIPPIVDFQVQMLMFPQRGQEPKAFSSGLVRVDTVANTLTYDITLFAESSLNLTTSYIYGNAIEPYEGSPLHEVTIDGDKLAGVWEFDESNQFGILAGMTYFQINTVEQPNGFSRGQIKGGMIPENRALGWEKYE